VGFLPALFSLTNQVITYWISADTHSYIVKEDEGTISKELSSIAIAEKYQPVRYDSGSGISLEAALGEVIGFIGPSPGVG
jgi:hypothetical protein